MSFPVAGLDEVGRGAFAGPLIAVAALFDSEKGADWRREQSPILGIDDSKKFTSHLKRVEVFKRILRSKELVDFGIGEVSSAEVDHYGVDYANRLAFYRALTDLRTEPRWLLVDGDNPCPGWSISRQDVRPRGDGYWWPTGAASILAKVIRDSYMIELGLDYPLYKFAQNSGYGTEDHRLAIKKLGHCEHHRVSFLKNTSGRPA